MESISIFMVVYSLGPEWCLCAVTYRGGSYATDSSTLGPFCFLRKDEYCCEYYRQCRLEETQGS